MDRRSNSIPPAPKPERAAPRARTGADGLLDDLKAARRDLLAGRHEAYHRIVGTLVGILGARDGATLTEGFERAWRTRSFPSFFERPLLVLATLRADALLEGPRHPLHAALATDSPDPEVVTADTVGASLARDRIGVWSTLTTRRVQTNDTSRAVAWLWPAFLAGCDGGRRPLALVDVGAGAGLNLVADRLPVVWTDGATRQEIPCATRSLNTVVRIGFDTRPLNVQSDDDVLWMRACIWPGETERLARFEAGVRQLRASTGPGRPTVERLTASLVPNRLDAIAMPTDRDPLLLVYQTLVRGYLEPSERDSYVKGMEGVIARRAPGRVLWVELELDDSRRRFPAALTAHVGAGDKIRSLRLARASQHPAELEVDSGAVAELRRYLTAPA